jgi:hypothetical protein
LVPQPGHFAGAGIAFAGGLAGATDSLGGGGGHVNYFYLPVVMQWNFWLHKSWSVFGEPGVALYLQDGDLEFTPLVLFVGGRYHLNDRITLTMRLGYPAFSFGVSFLL